MTAAVERWADGIEQHTILPASIPARDVDLVQEELLRRFQARRAQLPSRPVVARHEPDDGDRRRVRQ